MCAERVKQKNSCFLRSRAFPHKLRFSLRVVLLLRVFFLRARFALGRRAVRGRLLVTSSWTLQGASFAPRWAHRSSVCAPPHPSLALAAAHVTKLRKSSSLPNMPSCPPRPSRPVQRGGRTRYLAQSDRRSTVPSSLHRGGRLVQRNASVSLPRPKILAQAHTSRAAH